MTSQPRLDFSGRLWILAPFVAERPLWTAMVAKSAAGNPGAVQPQQDRFDCGVAIFVQGALLQAADSAGSPMTVRPGRGSRAIRGWFGSNLVDHHAADDLELASIFTGQQKRRFGEGAELEREGERVSGLVAVVKVQTNPRGS